MQVKDIMTKKVISVTPKTKVSEVAEVLWKKNLTGLPVVDQGKLVGIVTEYDLMSQKAGFHIPSYIKFLQSFDLPEDKDNKGFKKEFEIILNTKVKDIMTKKVYTVSPKTKIKDLAELILSKKINPVPVLNEKGKIVGIVSRSDVMKLFKK